MARGEDSSARTPLRRVLFTGGAFSVAALLLLVGCGGGSGDTQSYDVPSGSMRPTFDVGDSVSVDLNAYEDEAPATGDIVVFHPPRGASAPECGVRLHGVQPDEAGEACPHPTDGKSADLFLKRIVAVGGDSISIEHGEVVIDGTAQDEQSFTEPCADISPVCDLPKTIQIPPGYFFIMGDNRGESDDSRFWGPVPAAWIVGRVED